MVRRPFLILPLALFLVVFPARGGEGEDPARLDGIESEHPAGVSEIIFASPSFDRALAAWKRSARHHRSMISVSWTEAGASAGGPIPVDFGAGEPGAPPALTR